MLEVSVLMTDKVLLVRSGMSNTGASTKAALNLSNEDCLALVYTHTQCDPVKSVRGAVMSA